MGIPGNEKTAGVAIPRRFMEVMVNTSLGKFLRVNRSIQAEGSFAMTKEDMSFRRFLLRSTVKSMQNGPF